MILTFDFFTQLTVSSLSTLCSIHAKENVKERTRNYFPSNQLALFLLGVYERFVSQGPFVHYDRVGQIESVPCMRRVLYVV